MPYSTSLEFQFVRLTLVGTMNFQSVNKLLLTVNFLSANFFPVNSEVMEIPFRWKMYGIIFWIIFLSYISLSIFGLFIVPKMKSLECGSVQALVTVEVLMISVYVNCRRKFLKKLIKLINKVLENSDESKMQDIIRKTMDRFIKPMIIYGVISICTVAVWAGVVLIENVDKDQFTYGDYQAPMYWPGEPFTRSSYSCGVLLAVMGCITIVTKKMSIDIYTVHIITLMTSQFCYISTELKNILRESERIDQDHKYQASIKRDWRRLIRQQIMVIRAGQMVQSQLSLNVAVTYLSCTLRYCFLAYMFVGFLSSNYEKFLVITYITGSFIQLFMLCSSSQGLLDASKTVTERTFYKQWYNIPLRFQRLYAIMMISSKLECKLSAFGVADLTMPTFVLILKQSYSAFLFLLNVNV